MEESLKIRTPDKKYIYCTLGYPDKAPPKGTVIFVHGLASTELWPPMLLGSWYFRKKGYAYCRVNLYDWHPNARTLMKTDLLQHSKDVDTVTKYLKRKGHKQLFAVGHSFGGLTLLRTQTSQFKALSLWDISSFISYPPRQWLNRDRASGATYMNVGYELLMSKRFIRGIETFPDELKLISKIQSPTQICYASGPDAMLVESSKRYFEHLICEGELVELEGASHSFTEEGISQKLFQKTEKWFQKTIT